MQLTDNNGNVFGINGLEITGPDGKPKGGGSGAQGPAGPQGIQGITGIQGLVGIQGVQGITGIGTQGTQGITGTGSQGTTGIQGVQGVQGSSGGGGGTVGLQGIHIITKPLSGVYYNAQYTQSQSTIGVGSGILYLYPFIPNNTLTINELNIEVTTAGAGNSVKVGIYSNVNGLPNTKLIESASFDMTTTGIKTFITSFTFNAGTTYWIGHIGNGFSGAIRSMGFFPVIAAVNGASNFNAFAISTSFSSLPSTLTVSSGNLTGAAGLAKINFKQV